MEFLTIITHHIGWFGLLGLLGGYLLGSIPFGLVFCKLAGVGDIRSIGSGNIGATNVLRTGRKGLAAATLILDSSKGLLAVLLFSLLAPQAMFGAALGAVLGHNYPIWLRFQGGKGVATTLGVLLALNLPMGLLCCATWLVTAFLSRISSLSALLALAAAPLFSVWVGEPKQIYLVALLAALGWWRHRGNLGRLYRGEETRISFAKKSPSASSSSSPQSPPDHHA